MNALLIFLLVILLLTLVCNANPTEVNVHKFNPIDGMIDTTGIDELVWKSLISMSLKKSIKATCGVIPLPIDIYNDWFYKQYKSIVQRQTRISSVTALWTPTSDNLQSTASLIVVDQRIKTDHMTKISTESSYGLEGHILAMVPFDPNFQQLLTGSIHVAPATKDINKIRFYLVTGETDMSKTDSYAGFLDITWKTVPDNNGVYLERKWDVFTFPRELAPEIANNFGKTAFEKYKRFFASKYDKERNNIAKITEMHNEMIMGSDQGYNQLKSNVDNRVNELPKILTDSMRRVEAIKLKTKKDDFDAAIQALKEASTGHDIDKIGKARDNLLETAKKYSIKLEIKNDNEASGSSDGTGYIVYGDVK